MIGEMASIRQLIAEGLKQRAAEGIKVRQPLEEVKLVLPFDITAPDRSELLNIVKEELNVHEVVGSAGEPASISLNIELTDELKREGLMREIVRQVQNARKQAGLNVDDRINVQIKTSDSEINKAIEQFTNVIKQETLAVSLNDQIVEGGFDIVVKIDGKELKINLVKS
jgi:isoleucyl-tRNA synthetase